jgi:hypothetical protein
MGDVSRRVARAFDVWDSETPFLRYDGGEEDMAVTRTEIAALGLAIRQALVELALAIEKLDSTASEDDTSSPPL